ncbi:MAG: hypothetical protein K6F15_07760 [Treponema sp.]|nr:hypothetical protein [Treponema sp.]
MNKVKHIVLPSLIIAASLFLTAFFRVIPASRLWNNYSVMYVQKEAPQEKVISLFSEYGVEDYICIFNQKTPLAVPSQSAEYSLATLSFSNYLEERKAYFYDYSKNFLIYYVPEKYEGKLNQITSLLNSEGIKSGINANASYPWLAFVFCLIFALFLTWQSKYKLRSLLFNFVPVFFTFTMPFYTVAVSQCLILTLSFFAMNLWQRKGAFSCILKNSTFCLLFLLSFVIVLFTNLKVAFFYILSLFCGISLLYLYKQISELFEKKYIFQPVLIRSAFFIRPITKKNSKIFFYCAVTSILIMISALISARAFNFSSDFASEKILLPSKSAAKVTLPGLNDYILWNWQASTFPYKSLNTSQEKESNSLIFPRFTEKNGNIEESYNSIEYNEKFRQNVIDSVDDFDYKSIELLLKKQGLYKGAGYSSSGSSSLNFITFVLLFVGTLVPAFLYFKYSSKKVKKQENK